MRSHWRFAALFAVIVSAMPMAPSAIAQTREDRARAVKGPDAVPGNYRQVIARHFAANPPRYKLLNALISPPGMWNSPLGASWSAPIACARLTVETSYSPSTYTVGFRFRNGQIIEAFDPEYNNPAAGGLFTAMLKNSVTCGPLTYRPYPELKQTLRTKR